jgi:transposase
MDLGTSYYSVTSAAVPHAAICFDPFHVIQIANRALDNVYSSTAREGRTRAIQTVAHRPLRLTGRG